MFPAMPAKNFGVKATAPSTAEHYLERILALLNSKGYAQVVDIAAALPISQACVEPRRRPALLAEGGRAKLEQFPNGGQLAEDVVGVLYKHDIIVDAQLKGRFRQMCSPLHH